MRLSEIITVDELKQPNSEELKYYSSLAQTHYREDLWYSKDEGSLIVVSKTPNRVDGLVVAQTYHNPAFQELPKFVVPHNLYSWAADGGATALLLIKAVIKLSDFPVVSDVMLTPASKKFLAKQIDRGMLSARTLNLNTGEVSPYDPTVFTRDDDFRVLLLDQPFGTPISEHNRITVTQSTWNHAALLRRLKRV